MSAPPRAGGNRTYSPGAPRVCSDPRFSAASSTFPHPTLLHPQPSAPVSPAHPHHRSAPRLLPAAPLHRPPCLVTVPGRRARPLFLAVLATVAPVRSPCLAAVPSRPGWPSLCRRARPAWYPCPAAVPRRPCGRGAWPLCRAVLPAVVTGCRARSSCRPLCLVGVLGRRAWPSPVLRRLAGVLGRPGAALPPDLPGPFVRSAARLSWPLRSFCRRFAQPGRSGAALSGRRLGPGRRKHRPCLPLPTSLGAVGRGGECEYRWICVVAR
ncbi:hypothetical protein SAMN05421748_104247 [Paractinoplanes atraurantiacus]|uniref:Uncharacterized protein n=1 Tax=Paractinoplanes atraurantiacus TaxID=1036182 RepID=A0A285HF00_9ACTN|nr:hypothetical protein SAMN05421748_104247 [Actinoplanes atraurantiacus]